MSGDLARGGGYIPLFSDALLRLGSVGVFSAEFCGWRAAVQEKEQAFRKASMLKPSYDLFFNVTYGLAKATITTWTNILHITGP